MGPIFVSPGDSHIKVLLFLLHPRLQSVTEVDNDLKRKFVSFKGTLFNDGVVVVYALSGHKIREQLARENFFEGLQRYMKNESKGNENKVILGDLNCTIDKMDKGGGNKTQRLYRCGCNYALSKLIVDKWLGDYGEEKTQISPSSSAMIDPLAQDSG